MTHTQTRSLLQRIELACGISFVEDMFEDFLNTQAFASFAYHTDLLKGAYDALATEPEWAQEVRCAGEVWELLDESQVTDKYNER